MNKATHLKDIGLKVTGPRLKILDLFQSSSSRHMSAEEVYRQLLALQMDIGLATVYRVLTQFEQAGIIERHHFENNHSVFEITPDGHHDHIVCQNCGMVVEFSNPLIEAEQHKVAEELGFELTGHSLNLYGTCSKPACKEQGKRRN